MAISAPPDPLRAHSSLLKPVQKRRMPRTSNQTVCSAGHRPMRTHPPVASCCGAMREALPISLRVVWRPPLPPAMMYRSRRAAKKARTTEPRQKGIHNGCGSTNNGHNNEVSCTEMLALDVQKRPATFSRASQAAPPNTRQMGPTTNRGPSICGGEHRARVQRQGHVERQDKGQTSVYPWKNSITPSSATVLGLLSANRRVKPSKRKPCLITLTIEKQESSSANLRKFSICVLS